MVIATKTSVISRAAQNIVPMLNLQRSTVDQLICAARDNAKQKCIVI